MKIVISAGGRFWAFHLAHQLDKRNSFLKLFSFSYTHKDRKTITPRKVHNILVCKLLDFIFLKLRLARLVNSSKFNHLKDNIFDYLVSKEIKKLEPFDFFIGWAHYAKKSLQAAKSKGALIVIESGSCHILEQQKLLEEEYKKWNINFTPISHKVIEKMLQEYEQADYIITLSSLSQQSFIKHGIPEHKMLKVPCGIEVDFFLNHTHKETQMVPHTKFRVIFVGLINIRKGIPYLLEAWKQANLPEEACELVLVGALQKDMAQYLPTQQLKKNIIFYGPASRETLRTLYAQSHLFVLPSVEDGFGMVMGEAMASGLPIICTTNTGAPDVITDGIEGYLVPPQNSAALAEKITWCYKHQDACKSMGQEGKKRICDFTWDVYGERVFEVYTKILEKKHSERL